MSNLSKADIYSKYVAVADTPFKWSHSYTLVIITVHLKRKNFS